MGNNSSKPETFKLIRFILERRKLNTFIFSFIFIISVVVVFFVIPKEYTAEVSILPSIPTSPQGLGGRLGGLANLAGINLGTFSTRSQEMYQGIITSRKLLERVIFHEFVFERKGEPKRMNLIEFFELEEEDDPEEEKIQKALKRLREDVIAINIDPENEILYLSTTMEHPEVAAMTANLIVDILNEIVLKEVEKEITEQYEFLNRRILETKDSLSVAEQELKEFLEKSKDPARPEFQVAQIRARRNLEVQTAIYVELRKQKEILYLENFANLTPIKVLDQAFPPYRKSRPKRLFLLITFVALAGFVQIGVNWGFYLYPKISSELKDQKLSDQSAED